MTNILYLTDAQIKCLLEWSDVFDATKEALLSVNSVNFNENQPWTLQPARSRISIPKNSGVLISMAAYVTNYKLPSVNVTENYSTLGCKLVTFFGNNPMRSPSLPSTFASILLFDTITGQLKCILDGFEITARRTAAASLVATKYLFFNRTPQRDNVSLAIIGCSVQGRIHAIGMLNIFHITKLTLWNRTNEKATNLGQELNSIRSEFINPEVEIVVCDNIDECVYDADIIVTATHSTSPLLFYDCIKKDAHINAIGSHSSEVESTIYANSTIFVDSLAGAAVELKALDSPIQGEVGDLISGKQCVPNSGITLFKSMGMAVEDCTVAQLVYEKYMKQTNCG